MRRELPTFYYHAHFEEMLDFVAEHYVHALLDEHTAFIREFRELPRDEQCLYVRLVNRKGRVFSERKLPYPELGDRRVLLATLREHGWVGAPGAADFDDVLGFLTRAEILDAVSRLVVGVGRSLKKAELVAFVRRNCDPAAFVREACPGRVFVQSRTAEVAYLLFLYFGRVQQGLSRFTMRDLGLVRTQSFRDAYEPRFAECEEALEHFYFASRLAQLDRGESATLAGLVDEAEAWPAPGYAGSAALRDRLAYRLGRWLEKNGETYPALRIYQRGESPQCTERVIFTHASSVRPGRRH